MTTQEILNLIPIKYYGVKGMRWGVTRSRAQLDRAAKVKSMSDDDLRKVISRMQLEKQYKDLTKSAVPTASQKAATFLKNTAIATTTALTLYNNYNKISDVLFELKYG